MRQNRHAHGAPGDESSEVHHIRETTLFLVFDTELSTKELEPTFSSPGRFHFFRIQFRIEYETNDGVRESDERPLTHLLMRRAPDVADAIPARSTSCRVPLFVSHAQLPAVKEMSHRRFRKIHDAVPTLHHRANCRQGSSAQTLQHGSSGRPPTRSRSVSSSTPATRATVSQLAPNQHGLHAAFRRLQQQLEWQGALGWSPRLYGDCRVCSSKSSRERIGIARASSGLRCSSASGTNKRKKHSPWQARCDQQWQVVALPVASVF